MRMGSKNTEGSYINRRDALKVTGAAVTVSLAGCTGGEGGGKTWRIGTGGEGGATYTIAATLVSYMNQEGLDDVVNPSNVTYSGALEAYRMLDEKQVESAIATVPDIENSPDNGPFEDEPLQNFDQVRQIRGEFTSPCFVVTKQDSDIESFEDLEGRDVYISPSGAGPRDVFEMLYDNTVGMDNIEPHYDSWDNMANLLEEEHVAAASVFILNQGTPVGGAQQLDQLVDWEPIPWPDHLYETVEENPGTFVFEVSGDRWSSTYTDSYPSASLPTSSVTHAEYSTETVKELTRITFEHGEELANQNQLLGAYADDEFALEMMSEEVPVHEGVYEYLTEVGLWDDQAGRLIEPPELNNE